MDHDFEQSSFDEEFRKNVRRLLDEAEEEIIIITGEGGSYRYQDLRWALERVSERGISIKIYCTHPPQVYLNKNLQLGSEIYVGSKDLDEHHLIVDRKHTIISAVRAGGEVGKRAGEIRKDNEKFAKEKVRLFNDLVSNAEKVTEIEIEDDPFWQLVNDPQDFSYDTHSERFEEEL